MNEVVIVAGARTPQGRLLGALAPLSAVDLGGHAITHALKRAGVETADVAAVFMGQAISAGCGQNPARQAALQAGLDPSVVCETINKVCLSGTASIASAARMIALEEADVAIAGGMESMTNAPHLVFGARKGVTYGKLPTADAMELDGLTDTDRCESMGLITDEENGKYHFDRQAQDELAAQSHQRAAKAQADGIFADEIAPIQVPQRRGEPVVVSDDEGIRPDSSAQTLAKLRPAFMKDGAITAGNSSPISDGAAALVVTSADYAKDHNLPILARIAAFGAVGGPDTSLHTKPARAIEQALARANWQLEDLDIIEVNEAFASVALASAEYLGVDAAKFNACGGAIAIGHPLGASGTRLVLHAASALRRQGGGRAAIALCGGGGQGDAVLLQR